MAKKTENKTEVKATAAKQTANTETVAATVENTAADTVKAEAAEKKETAKKTAGRKPAAKNTTEKKTTEKAASAKKTTAKKTADKAEPAVVIQYGGDEAVVESVIENVKNAFVAEGHRASSIKELKVYLKPEERLAYYVINEKFSGKVDLF